MAERKWGAIASGATFEALATTIVFFEDPAAALFGRRGKDGGQDARSGDGTRVFQAKHHEDASSTTAIRDARKEAEKIQAYRQPDHARYEQWKGVTHWRLVTNAAFNPTDKQAWDTEVVPRFAAQGLTADYWERENLNALLDKHPEIHRSFFENETRAFLTVPELREWLLEREPFLRRAELGRFCGREAELREFRAFLASSHRFLVVHGAGGLGKTRLLAEAGESIASEGAWQVLWANVASMSTTAAWFDAVVPERPTLLLVDEPPDIKVLQQLTEQLGGRAAHWKVAVAVRSPNDPVLRFLFGARMKARVRELALSPLLEPDARALCADLLSTSKFANMPEEARADTARELSRRFARHPIWLTLAVHLLEEHGDLSRVPATAEGLANEYLGEVERSQSESPPEKVRDLLRWVALIGTVNREDNDTVQLIGDAIGTGELVEVRQKLAALVLRHALAERGARRRFVEIKPDVLRDHILLTWLSVDVGFGEHPIVASDDAKALLKEVTGPVVTGSLSRLGLSILVSLARTEFLLQLSGHDLQLLAGFFEALHAALPKMTASQRLKLADVLDAIAAFQPAATARVIRAMRQSEVPDETIEGLFGVDAVRQSDILLKLAWPLLHAAMGAQSSEAQEAVLRELAALAEVEAELAPQMKRGLLNDGKRAAALIERVLEGGPQFWAAFDGVAKTLGDQLLTELARQPPTPGKTVLLKALIQPAIALERRQTWGDEHAIHIQTFTIGPDHPAWSTRNALLARIKDTLSADTTPVASRAALWHVFAEAHRGLRRMYRQGEPKGQQYYDALLSDLVWTRDILKHRGANIEELSAARKLWEWLRRHASEPQLKVASEQLEALYEANELANEFEPLVSRADWGQRGPRMVVKAAELAATRSPEDIAAFVQRAVTFLGGEHELYQLRSVASSLGEHAEAHEVVQAFVKRALGEPVVTPRTDFGVEAAVCWVASVRRGDHAKHTYRLVTDLMASCGSDKQRANLLLQIYGRIPTPQYVREFSADEHTLLRAQGQLFIDTGRSAEFVGATAPTIEYDWPSLRTLLEGILRSMPPEKLAPALRSLFEGLHWAVTEAEPASLPAGLGEWLLSQLLLVPNFDDLDEHAEWYLEEILQRVGRVHVSWLPGALAVRRDLEVKPHGAPRVRAVSYDSRISKYVRRIEAADAGNRVVGEAVYALLAFVDDTGSIGDRLPKVLHDVDPDGLVVPSAIVARLARAVDADQVRQLARVGGGYVVGTAAWRTIVKAAIAAGLRQGIEERQSIFDALTERGIRSWVGKHGEVHEIFVSAVRDAKTALDSEVDVDLRPFWEWRLEVAEKELRREEEGAKEERGE
jgi:hypothetical protein